MDNPEKRKAAGSHTMRIHDVAIWWRTRTTRFERSFTRRTNIVPGWLCACHKTMSSRHLVDNTFVRFLFANYEGLTALILVRVEFVSRFVGAGRWSIWRADEPLFPIGRRLRHIIGQTRLVNRLTLRDLRPVLMRAELDVTKVVFVAIDARWVIQSAGISGLRGRTALLYEANVGPAYWAKLQVQPTSRIIDSSVQRKVTAQQLEVLLFPLRDHRKSGTGTPLASFAMTDHNDIRIARHAISDFTAYTSTLV